MADGAAWRHWCQGDGVTQLQDHASNPPRTSFHVNTTPQPLIRTHTRPISSTPASTVKVPYKSATDNMCQYYPPPGTRPRKQEEGKCAVIPLHPQMQAAQAASFPGVRASQVRRARQDGWLGAAQRQPRRLSARGLRPCRAQDHHVHVQRRRRARDEARGQGRPVSPAPG